MFFILFLQTFLPKYLTSIFIYLEKQMMIISQLRRILQIKEYCPGLAQNETEGMVFAIIGNTFVAWAHCVGHWEIAQVLFRKNKNKMQSNHLKSATKTNQVSKLQQSEAVTQIFDVLDFYEIQTKLKIHQENNFPMIQETLKSETPKQSKERIIIPATPYNIFPKIKTLQINDFFENKKSKTLELQARVGMSISKANPRLIRVFLDLKSQEISSKLQQLIISKHQDNMFFSNPYAIWTPTVSPYQYYYFTSPLTNQNYLLQDILPTQSEVGISQSKNTYPAQPFLQKENAESKTEQSLENAQIEGTKFINHSILENSKKMKKTMKNHNVLPNIMNTILSYVRRRNKTGTTAQKIIHKQKTKSNLTSPTLNKYYAYQIYLHSKIPKSKHESSLRYIVNHLDTSLDAFSIQEQLFYNRVCRILILELLNQEFLLTFLTTQKCAKTSKSDHLKARRFIIALLKQGFNSQESTNLS